MAKKKINERVENFNNNIHSQWVERYRPTVLSDLALSDKLQPFISSYIEKEEVPNMILYGEAGTGKNSIVRGMDLEEGATTILRNKLIGGHNAYD